MKRIFRITSLILLCLLLILSMVSCGGNSAASASGACGSGVTWEYDSETNALTISGNGEMTNFESSSDMPWITAKYSVKSITVSEGITSIGDFAFYSFTALEEVTLNESLVSIGDSAFAFCSALKTLSLPESVTSIGNYAFSGCSALTTAFIPAAVTELGTGVFAHCYALTDAAWLTTADIPAETFFNCRSIERLTLIEGKQAANDTAFKGCSKDLESAERTSSETAAAAITVNFVYEDGSEAAPTVVKESIAYGDSYSIVSPSIEGYTADKLTVTGNLYGADKEVNVTYTKDVVEEEPVVDEEPKEEIGASTIIAIVIFAVVLIGIGIGAFLLMRSDKKNNARGTTVRKNDKNSKKRK